MPLFDEILRTDTRPRGQNESSFDYMNLSARPGIQAIRDLLENWFDHLPETAKPDVLGKFRSRIEIQNQSAFFEMFCHELLLSSGYEAVPHPALLHVNTAPDFLASRGNVPRFYLEATSANPRHAEIAADRRFATLHDTLDRMDSPDYFLNIEYHGYPQENINGRRLRQRLEEWLRNCDFETISQLYREQNYEAIPTFPWSEAGCHLTFTPIPKGPPLRGQLEARPVGIVFPEARWLATHEGIRTAIEEKATKYGHLSIPLVVAINVTDDFCDDHDIWNALFGEEQVVFSQRVDGQISQGGFCRSPNGAWRGLHGPRNSLVSAVLITHQLTPSTLRSHPVELIHNPWAVNAFPLDALGLPQKVVNLTTAQITQQLGICAGDLLQIPATWPIPD